MVSVSTGSVAVGDNNPGVLTSFAFLGPVLFLEVYVEGQRNLPFLAELDFAAIIRAMTETPITTSGAVVTWLHLIIWHDGRTTPEHALAHDALAGLSHIEIEKWNYRGRVWFLKLKVN
jgi:hypothetical protein